MKSLLRKMLVLVTIALTFQAGFGNYITPTTFAATGPILTLTGGSASFVAGDNSSSTPVAIDYGITVTSDSGTTLESATVAITGNFHAGEDVLMFINHGQTMGNITASYNAATGVLTLTSAGATATLAQWQAALRTITYTDTAITPNTATRTVSFTVTDGVDTSNTATRIITVVATNQTPILTTSGGSTNYISGALTPVAIDSGLMVSDLDNATLASASVSIISNFDAGKDVLVYTNDGQTMGNITASYTASTGVLTLTSAGATATLAQWQSALRSISFSSTSATPGQRIISYSVNDGVKTSVAVTRTVEVKVITPLSLTTSSGSASFVAGDNASSIPVVIDSAILLTIDSSTTLASATVAITGNLQVGEDLLLFTNNGLNKGNIVASYTASNGVLTLTSAGSTATWPQWQNALRSIAYASAAITPNTADRTVSFNVTDGVDTSNTATRIVTVATTDQTPIVTTSGSTTNYISGASTPVSIDSALTVFDLDNATLSSATVSIASNFDAGKDVLEYTNDGVTMGNITSTYSASTGVLTLISSGGTATLAQWQRALRGVSFSSTSATPGLRNISYIVSDGTKTSVAATHTVEVTVIAPPMLTTSSGSSSFVAGDNIPSTPVVIDSGITVTADSNTTLASATVAITGNLHVGEDVLRFINDGLTMGNITASYNASTGVLTLTSSGGMATLVQWQAALRSITYTNTAIKPNTATRVVSFTVTDDDNVSNTAARTVMVMDTNQTPIVTTSDGSTNYISGTSTPVAIDGGLTVSDLDNATLASATVSIASHFDAGKDVLAYINDGASMGNITANYDALMGVLTLTSAGGTATLAQWQNALQAVTYSNTQVSTNMTTRTISFTVSDGNKMSGIATKSITLQGLNSLKTATNTLSVSTGQTVSVAITAVFSDQSQRDVTSWVTWTVRNPSIANVTSGRVTGKAAGSTVVSAVYGTQSVDINLTVTGTPVTGSGSSPSSSTNTSTSIDNSTPVKTEPSIPPAKETKHFQALVETDRLVAFIKGALAGNTVAVTFQDAASHWASKDILSAAKIGIINGYPDGRFKPDASITRAEFSALLVKAFALRSGSGTIELLDIQNSWARESIEILASNGVINGYSDGTFHADYRITRAEMVAMISKILIVQNSAPGDAATFVDVAPKHWAKEIIETAAKSGLLEGKSQNRFEPDANLTRAEALTVIMRMLRENPTIDQLLG
ncbi:S-layer homology domain-containing protein [Paenibacillus amylolyticus]|uniref:S-layer homology domain-containing protein n=1 Tax=Paenibacillus amylolyticus TaxID=1451 RepID=A0A5M9X165_PAEAM|nr:S-layer homology domain-containing protein [Paenibacillus amylolyticus]KAA8787601.1 S-layer homology domain-containing protein [Paenibacillus amylolyticus]